MTAEQDAAAVNALADWSPWVPFAGDLADVPRLPGVYMFRQPGMPGVVYVGMAGERAGSGVPQGLRDEEGECLLARVLDVLRRAHVNELNRSTVCSGGGAEQPLTCERDHDSCGGR